MAKYQGHKNWNHWNVSLWINNDEGLYRMALNFIKFYPKAGYGFSGSAKAYAAKKMLERLRDEDITHTPDGAPYSVSSIRAAMVGLVNRYGEVYDLWQDTTESPARYALVKDGERFDYRPYADLAYVLRNIGF